MANTLSAKIRAGRRRARTGRPDGKNFAGYFSRDFFSLLIVLYLVFRTVTKDI